MMIISTNSQNSRRDLILKAIRVFTFIFFLPLLGFGQGNKRQFKISYISSGRIYVDAGNKDGLNINDTLVVMERKLEVAVIRVLHVSSHSSSCEVISSRGTITKGMTVRIPAKKETEIVKEVIPVQRKRAQKDKRKTKYGKKQISGSITLSNFSFMDEGQIKHSVHQPGIRLKLKVREIFQEFDRFEIYFRSRYYYRSGYSGYAAPNEAWRNRLYGFSYQYTKPTAKINYQLGRFSSNVVSGIGFLDGGQLQYAMHRNFKTGLFAGAVSRELFSTIENPSQLQRYGIYIQYNYVGSSANLLSLLSASGEYHGQDISREFLFMKNSLSISDKVNLYQSMEIDFNRNWREKKGMDKISLSNLFLKLDYWFVRGNRISFRYDNRKNFYTYDNQSVPDSLFDSAIRQGFQVSYSGRFGRDWSVRLFGGLRNKISGDKESYSYGLSATKHNLFAPTLNASFAVNSVSNQYTEGYNPNLRIYKSWQNGLVTGIGGGGYWYEVKALKDSFEQYWFDLFINGNLFRRSFFSVDLEYLQNNGFNSYRLNIQLGYRF